MQPSPSVSYSGIMSLIRQWLFGPCKECRTQPKHGPHMGELYLIFWVNRKVHCSAEPDPTLHFRRVGFLISVRLLQHKTGVA